MNLIAVAACQNVGHIDWEPYIPMIFTRIMRSLDLPVCYKNTKSARNQSLWSSSIASTFDSKKSAHRRAYNCFAHFAFVSFSFSFSLDCICVEPEELGPTLSHKIPGCHRVVFASGKQRQMAECHQRHRDSAAQIFVRSVNCRTVQAASVEETDAW